MWMGGTVPLGYDAKDRTLVIIEPEAEIVRELFQLYLELGTVREVTEEANRRGLRTKLREDLDSRMRGGLPFYRGHIYRILTNPLYIGQIQHKKDTYPGLHPAIIDQDTWDTVQQRMNAQRVNRRGRTNAKHPSPLAGKIFDDRGRPFTPSHAVKNGRRYRYYVEQAATRKPKPNKGQSYRRIPATAIEGLVSDAISCLLLDSNKLLAAIGAYESELTETKTIVQHATRLAARLQKDNASAWQMIIRKLVARVELAKTEVYLKLNRDALHECLEINATAAQPEDNLYLMTIPAQLRSRGEELKFVISDSSEQIAPHPDPVLIKALVKAHAWVRAMTEDNVALNQIAAAEGVTNGHIRRYMKLAFLAPDITRAILDGRQAADLSLERITRPQEFPLDWDQQRRLFGA